MEADYSYDPKSDFCRGCFNVLPYVGAKSFKEELLSTIKNSGFEYSSYLLTINTPVYFIVSDALLLGELIQNKLIDPFKAVIATQTPYGKLFSDTNKSESAGTTRQKTKDLL